MTVSYHKSFQTVRNAGWGMRLVLTLILFGGCIASLNCRAQSTVSAPPTGQSVRPGINKEYKRPDLDVAQWVERFEREGREIYDHRQKIVQALNLRPGMVVADIGAGTGLFSLLFARQVGTQGQVVAVDIVSGFLKHVEEQAQQAGLDNIRTVLCKEDSVELEPESIDIAFICDAYHHFEYPEKTMRSVHRALRPNGRLVVVEFRRTEGKSSEWVLQHVRAGQAVFTREIEAAGFALDTELDLLQDNYVLSFTRD